MIRLERIFLALALGLFLTQAGNARAVDSFSGRVLAAHNAERSELGLQPLVWSVSLAREAESWALLLAREGRMRHASQLERRSHGENLWMGSAGIFSVETIIGTFLAERRHFRPGKFPDISRTGNWKDAGHYSQVIWPRTRAVGCAMVEAKGMEYFVCRYDPGGNWIGEFVGTGH